MSFWLLVGNIAVGMIGVAGFAYGLGERRARKSFEDIERRIGDVMVRLDHLPKQRKS